MTALFADTFYCIALADFNDSAQQCALALTLEQVDQRRALDGAQHLPPSPRAGRPCHPACRNNLVVAQFDGVAASLPRQMAA